MSSWPRWVRGAFGAVLGVVVGGVVAVNVQIFSGVATGYEASLAELFDHSPAAAVAVVAAWVAGPVVGGWLAVRRGS